MRFYQSQKAKFSIPIIPVSGFCRSTGPLNRARSRSTESVDRRAQTCTRGLAAGSVDRVSRPPESFCSLESPGRRVGRPAESSALCSRPWSTGPVDRGSNGRISDNWRSTGPVDRQPSRLKIQPNGQFCEAYKRGFPWTVLYKIWRGFLSQFFLLY